MRHLFLPALLLAIGCDSPEWRPAVVPAEALAIAPQPGAEESDMLADDLGPEEIDPKELSMKISQFSPTRISADLSKLPKNEKAALDKLIEASKLLDPVFDRQVYAKNP